ncbi:MAG: hypothetical protein QXJ93_01020 [Candidatus Rehaiarchaeum fermentans]|nr:hypothetical protein [Candidatus Rehaiarchaeum fermentans]
MANTQVIQSPAASQLREVQIATIVPSSLTAANIVPFPNLLRGVVHLRHWLDFSITVEVENTNSSAGAPGGTVNPKGALAYLTNILYKTNNISNIINASGYQLFHIGMAQGLMDYKSLSSYIASDNLFNIPSTSIAASGGTASFTANYRIPINFAGTQVLSPAGMGFSTLNEDVIKNFEIDISFGSISNLVSGLASGFNASITSASVTIYNEFYPGNLVGYQPSVYFELNIAANSDFQAAANGSEIKLTYGQNQIYKRLFCFTETISSPFNEPSDNQVTNWNLIYNSTNNLMLNLDSGYAKASYQYRYNHSLPVGMYIFDRLFTGNLMDVLNTAGFSDLKMTINNNANTNVQIVAEKLKANVLLSKSNTAKAKS